MSQFRTAGPLHLSDHVVRSLGFDPGDILACVERAVCDQARSVPQVLKTTVEDEAGNYFQALPALLPHDAIAGVKWVSVIADAGSRPSVQATLLLTSVTDGTLLAVVDGAWITAARTAAMSSLAARRLARPDPERVGFVGCGAQAMAHLQSLKFLFPSLSSVTACGRSRETAAAFCREAQALMLTARVATSPREAVEDQDIVVSSVPAASLERPFLDGRWLKPGAFAAMVDLGRSWKTETLVNPGLVATDARTQSEALATSGKLALAGPYDYDFFDLVLGPPVWLASRSSIFVFGGLGVCDLAVALLCYRQAVASGLAHPLQA